MGADPVARGTILVVDDDPSIRFLCRVNLELDGWTVREAGSVAEAREVVHNEQVSVVLLDMHLGSESGAEFARELRIEHPSIPVALLTGSAESQHRPGELGDAVIAKPFTLDELLNSVRRLAAPIESSR